MNRRIRRIGLTAGLAATMASAGAAPASAEPKLVTGNPGQGATVIHCNRLPGGKSVLVITPSGRVAGNCRGVTAPLPREVFEALPPNVRALLPPALVPLPLGG